MAAAFHGKRICKVYLQEFLKLSNTLRNRAVSRYEQI